MLLRTADRAVCRNGLVVTRERRPTADRAWVVCTWAGETLVRLVVCERDGKAEMAEEVRAKLFTFEDIVTLDDRAVQQILRQVDTRGLAISLKGTEEVVRDKVLKNMSSRASENLLEEIDMLKGIRAADVKESRGEIVKVIRTLEDSGDIVINRGTDEVVD